MNMTVKYEIRRVFLKPDLQLPGIAQCFTALGHFGQGRVMNQQALKAMVIGCPLHHSGKPGLLFTPKFAGGGEYSGDR